MFHQDSQLISFLFSVLQCWHDIDSFVDRDQFERKEGEGIDSEHDFKQRILENAPRSKKDYILTDVKKW